MRRTLVVGMALAMSTALFVGTGSAARVHWKSGPNFSDAGTKLTVSGSLAGLGNEDVTITVVAEGKATKIECTNPSGKKAPGQNKPDVRSLGEVTIDQDEIKNGNVSFSITTHDPAQLTPREAGCPNNRWTAEILDVEFESATITVRQGGKVVLQDSFDL